MIFSMGYCGSHLGHVCDENTTLVSEPLRIPSIPVGTVSAIAAGERISAAVIGTGLR
jgi:hypothetical protein